ncbi:hypothetical protein PG985_011282 [Apiospora marii]|uniref:uncharacterized protein n=1 Tax=Apiospora marii TaxID=335849 RepID=UPI00312D4A22
MDIGGMIESAGRPTNGQYGVVQGVRKNPITNNVEIFEGRLCKWASNVCHLDDAAVTVEPLEGYEVEHQDDSVQSLLNTLTPALIDDVTTPTYLAYEYSHRQGRYGVVIEDFRLNGFKVHRRTYPMFDAKAIGPKGYSKWPRAEQIQQQATNRAKLDQLSQEETLHAIASLLLTDKAKLKQERRFWNRDGNLRRKLADMWPMLKAEVHGQMFRTRNDPEKRREVMQGFRACRGRTDAEYEACLKMASDMYDKAGPLRDDNKHHDYLVDVEAGKLCDVIRGKDIKPNRDPRSPNCPRTELHRAVCGVEHYGLRTELIAADLAHLKFQRFSQAKHGFGAQTKAGPGGDAAWQNEFPKLLTGLYGLATKQLRESLVRWDPLVDPLTEGHRDVTDFKHGLAGLVTFGDFDQGGDLVLKELGVRIPFPSGSHCHLRGRELHHAITEYTGGNKGGLRHSLVMTNKETVRRLHHDRLDPGVKVIEAAVAQALGNGDYTAMYD